MPRKISNRRHDTLEMLCWGLTDDHVRAGRPNPFLLLCQEELRDMVQWYAVHAEQAIREQDYEALREYGRMHTLAMMAWKEWR